MRCRRWRKWNVRKLPQKVRINKHFNSSSDPVSNAVHLFESLVCLWEALIRLWTLMFCNVYLFHWRNNYSTRQGNLIRATIRRWNGKCEHFLAQFDLTVWLRPAGDFILPHVICYLETDDLRIKCTLTQMDLERNFEPETDEKNKNKLYSARDSLKRRNIFEWHNQFCA